MSVVRFMGSLRALSSVERALLFDRSTSSDAAVRERTASIITRVRDDGDAALRALAGEYDGVTLDALEVQRSAWDGALEQLDPGLRSAMERTVRNVRRAHAAFLPTETVVETEPGVQVGRRPDPLQRVGVYAPGGRAAYPSSVIMGVTPAKVAGVPEVVVCSPPGSDGQPSAVVLAAAALAGADRVFALGGAGAIAAMAHGTTSVPRVDRIVGPGNAYVAEAKLQCAGAVAIDAPAGPSELLVLADGSASPEAIVREMLAQAEHDPRAAVVCVTWDAVLAANVIERLDRAVPGAPREAIIRDALQYAGGVLVAESEAEAVAFANTWAAEHLLLVVSAASEQRVHAQLRGAGTVFLGEPSSVAFGDYMTGANHVLPTGGLARCYSGLSTLDFVRWTTWQRVSREAAVGLSADVGRFAESEGLPNHARAARAWSTS
jgi:histidinol dehydrogenase